MTTTTSQQFTWNIRDVLKGLVIAVILPILTIIQNSIAAGTFTLDWKNIGLTALGGFIAYMIKNFLTPAEIVMKDPTATEVKAVQEGKAEAKIIPQ